MAKKVKKPKVDKNDEYKDLNKEQVAHLERMKEADGE